MHLLPFLSSFVGAEEGAPCKPCCFQGVPSYGFRDARRVHSVPDCASFWGLWTDMLLREFLLVKWVSAHKMLLLVRSKHQNPVMWTQMLEKRSFLGMSGSKEGHHNRDGGQELLQHSGSTRGGGYLALKHHVLFRAGWLEWSRIPTSVFVNSNRPVPIMRSRGLPSCAAGESRASLHDTSTLLCPTGWGVNFILSENTINTRCVKSRSKIRTSDGGRDVRVHVRRRLQLQTGLLAYENECRKNTSLA